MNADDFGGSSSINRAVVKAHRMGVLTSASLMVAGDAFDEAVSIARETPSLAVGLHIVLVNGKAVLPPQAIPDLVDAEGFFHRAPVSAGLSFFFRPLLQNQLSQELSAQFERFANTGLPLSHVDGHLHMHMHPTVFGMLLPLAVRYGACGIRLPRDDFRLSASYDREGLFVKAAWAVVFSLLSRWSLRRMRSLPLMVTDRVYGLMQTGRMQEAYVMQVLRRLNVPTAELYFHPDTSESYNQLGSNPRDLETLLSPRVSDILRERGILPITYLKLKAG